MISDLNSYKESFITFVEKCFENDILSNDYKLLVNDYYIDNIGQLADIGDASIDSTFNEYSEFLDSEVKIYLDKCLPYLSGKIEEYFNLEDITYNTPLKKQITIQSIFAGLQPSGNNNSDYDDVPSALALAKFKPNV